MVHAERMMWLGGIGVVVCMLAHSIQATDFSLYGIVIFCLLAAGGFAAAVVLHAFSVDARIARWHRLERERAEIRPRQSPAA